MPNLYKLPCSCGLILHVETNHAGRQLDCSCGNQVQVPTLSGILNLEPVTEQEVQKKVKSRKPALRSIHTKQVVMAVGAVALLVTGILFIRGAIKYPQLYDVCLMQRYYVHDGKVIGRDSQPISPRDFRLLVDERIAPPRLVIWSEEVIKHHPYLVERPILLIEMHDNFKGGPELSYHFNEKYDTLVFRYWAGFVVLGVLTLISLIVLIVGIFLPKHVEDIGERGGESWE